MLATALWRLATVYAVMKSALDEGERLTRSTHGDLPSSRNGMPRQGRVAEVVFRDDVVKRLKDEARATSPG